MERLFEILKKNLVFKHTGSGNKERDIFQFPIFKDGEQIVLAILPKGTIYPPHSHEEGNARLYILSGKGVIILEQKKIIYDRGSVFNLTKGIMHGYEVEEETLVLSIQEKAIKYGEK
jgi:quercetin dioxygenase-like cupin family protein